MDENGIFSNEINIYSGSGLVGSKETFNADASKLIKSSNYLVSEILNEETWVNKYLNNDGFIGDIISDKVASYNDTKELYEVYSGGLVVESSGMNAGSYLNPSHSANNQFYLKQLTQKEKSSLFQKQSDSYGLTFLDNGHLGTPTLYWDDGKSWNKENIATGFHEEQIKLNLSQLLIEEDRYNVDLSGDNQVGDRIAQTLSNHNKVSHATGLYKTVSGAYVF